MLYLKIRNNAGRLVCTDPAAVVYNILKLRAFRKLHPISCLNHAVMITAQRPAKHRHLRYSHQFFLVIYANIFYSQHRIYL